MCYKNDVNKSSCNIIKQVTNENNGEIITHLKSIPSKLAHGKL